MKTTTTTNGTTPWFAKLPALRLAICAATLLAWQFGPRVLDLVELYLTSSCP